MSIIEITYRYDGTDATARPRPTDADAARDASTEGSRSIGALLDSLTDGRHGAARHPGGSARPRPRAGRPGTPRSAPTPRCSAVPTRACRSN